MKRETVGLLAVGLAILLGIGYTVRPMLHGLVLFFYTSPPLTITLFLAIVVTAILSTASPDDPSDDIPTHVLFGVVLAVGLVILFPVATAASLFSGETLGKQTISGANEVDGLSDVDADEPRIVTQNVSRSYASNTLQLSQYEIEGPADISFRNGTPYWSYALAPGNLRNYFTKKQDGAVYVNMTSQNADVETTRGEMDAGVGTAWYNKYSWKLLKNSKYLVNYGDPFMVPYGNETYIAVSYTEPEFHVRGIPPVPYTTPKWGGVALIAPNGSIENLSPAEARASPVLKGQKLVPFDLTRERVTSTSYRNGIINTLPVVGSQNDTIEVAPTPGSGNDQPYLVPTKQGTKYIVAAEPAGAGQGLKEIWEVDARTGQASIYRTGGETLFGPTKAANYVRQASRTTDWNRFSPAEPIPAVVNDRLYWMIKVIPSGGSGISYVAYVDARTANVEEASSTAAIEAFLRGNDSATTTVSAGNGSAGANASAGGASAPAGGDVSIIVERRGPNGEVVETMTIYENESVEIDDGSSATTPGSAAGANATNATEAAG